MGMVVQDRHPLPRCASEGQAQADTPQDGPFDLAHHASAVSVASPRQRDADRRHAGGSGDRKQPPRTGAEYGAGRDRAQTGSDDDGHHGRRQPNPPDVVMYEPPRKVGDLPDQQPRHRVPRRPWPALVLRQAPPEPLKRAEQERIHGSQMVAPHPRARRRGRRPQAQHAVVVTDGAISERWDIPHAAPRSPDARVAT